MNNNNAQDNPFWKTAADDVIEVGTWPAWMQSITISAASASTGCFIQQSNSSKSNCSGSVYKASKH